MTLTPSLAAMLARMERVGGLGEPQEQVQAFDYQDVWVVTLFSSYVEITERIGWNKSSRLPMELSISLWMI
jgi:hypothetical protein